jgi:hypothetical protein
MPFAAAFIRYISPIILSTFAFLRSRKSLRYYPLIFAGAFIVFALNGFHFSSNTIVLTSNAVVPANEPFGVAQGIFPGRG